jgi:hypothetical protein
VAASPFDDRDRDDHEPAGYDEPTFTFLDRRAGAKWQRVRDLVDEWLDHVPDAPRGDLQGRLQAGTATGFRSSFFELYCHEALRRSGWRLEHHPCLGHSPRHPDLLASRSGVTAYVEVTTTSKPRLDEAAEARLSAVIDAINDRMEIGDFMLGLDILSVGAAAPATGPLCTRLRSWLSGLSADELISAGSRGAEPDLETEEWTQGGWALTFEAYPLPADRRGPGGRIIGTSRPAEAHIIDDVRPLRKRLTAKAKAYGKLDTPFVIAVDAVSESTGDRDFISALYGTHAVRYYQNAGRDAPPPAAIRLPDGLWARPHGWHHTQVSAVLASTAVMPWTVGSAVPTLWHHAGADLPVGTICPLLRQARLDPATRQIRYKPPEMTPHEFFGLPRRWPEQGS